MSLDSILTESEVFVMVSEEPFYGCPSGSIALMNAFRCSLIPGACSNSLEDIVNAIIFICDEAENTEKFQKDVRHVLAVGGFLPMHLFDVGTFQEDSRTTQECEVALKKFIDFCQ